MEAKELMVDDWVQYQEETCKVVSIHLNGIHFRDSIGEGLVSFDRIDGIPITKEFLEKNGWKQQDFKHKYVYRDNYCRVIAFLSDKIFNDEEITATSVVMSGALFDINITLYYVHELQHALKLCGIDKEIIL